MKGNYLSIHYFQGHCFVALDPSVFAPGFEDRLSSLMNHCRDLDPVRKFKVETCEGKRSSLFI